MTRIDPISRIQRIVAETIDFLFIDQGIKLQAAQSKQPHAEKQIIPLGSDTAAAKFPSALPGLIGKIHQGIDEYLFFDSTALVFLLQIRNTLP